MQHFVSHLASPGAAPARRRWTAAALSSLALLVVPLAVWLALPPPVSSTPRSRPEGGDEVQGRAAPTAPSPARAAAAATTAARPVESSRAVGGDVEGDVQDPDARPAAHASVRCTVGAQELEALTDEAGHFRLGAEAAGCSAVAHKEHFGPSPEEALRAGTTNHLRLTPPTGIAGKVVDESGAPVVGFTLAVDSFEPAGGAKDGGAAQARPLGIDDVEGAFEWTDLLAGRYTLAIGLPGGPLARSQPIEVTAERMTRGVRIVTHPAVTVVGTVTDASTHAPVDGARVFVVLGASQTHAVHTRGGAFKIDSAPSEPFDLHVFRFGYVEQIVRGLRGRPGGDPIHVDVAMQKQQDDATPPSGG